MKLPRGVLASSRVVDDHSLVLRSTLDDAVTGYLVLEPAGSLLLDDDGACVITVADGVPVLASHTSSGRGGADALAALAGPGPVQVERHRVDADELAAVHDADGVEALAVDPGEPARVLTGDDALATRTRDRASDDHPGRDVNKDPLAAFLDDTERIDALREDARAEAERRAAEWGFVDELD
jgi:hypothetical protein